MKRKVIISLIMICLISAGSISCAGEKDENVGKDFPLSRISSGKLVVKDVKDILPSLEEESERFDYIEKWFGSSVSAFGDANWSLDEKEIIFSVQKGRMDIASNIWKMRIDRSYVQQLTNDENENQNLAVSPDGKKIVFETTLSWEEDSEEEIITNIYVMDVDGKNLVQLTNTGNDSSPSWSPDGKRIVFARCQIGKGGALWIMNSDGSNQVQLTTDGNGARNPSWSPDGTKIAFNAFKNQQGDIYIINIDGTSLKQLTTDPKTDECPKWSPDGTKILFGSERSGYEDNFWIMNADGSEQTHLITKIKYTYTPSWSSDGTKIVFGGMVEPHIHPIPSLYIMTLGVQE